MSLAQEVTNLYLYGQDTTPSDLSDESLIRPNPISPNPVLDIDVQDYMQNGGGRFAIGSQFEIIEKFFEDDSVNPKVSPSVQPYTKQEIGSIFGLGFYGWNMQQKDIQDETDDYTERAYVFNTQSFQISDDARFIVDPITKDKRIENFAVEPNDENPDDFDFTGGSILANLIGGTELVPKIDPSGIGRTVEINYVGEVPRVTYEQSDYEADVIRKIFFQGGNYVQLLLDTRILVDDLFNSGVTRFIENNKPIIYGTDDSDSLSASSELFFVNPLVEYPTLVPYRDNGAIVIGGNGDDSLTGTSISNAVDEIYGGNGNDNLGGFSGDDKLFGESDNDNLSGGSGQDQLDGGDGNDELDGGLQNDLLIGGKGNDTLNGGEFIFGLFPGNDTAAFSDNYVNDDESLNYSIETVESEFAGIEETITTISHIAGTQTDGTDTLENVEFARFKDTILPIPLEDGEKNTALIEVPNPAPSINNPNDLHAANYLGFTSPISMLDGDVEPTVHYSLVPPDEPYNIAFIIDTSASMSVAELAEVKDAYINLTNYFIDNEIAENSNFAVINFSRDAVLQANLTAEQAISAIQNLTPTTNVFAGTKYNDALYNAFLFFLQSPLDLGKENNIAFFTSDGKSQTNFADPYDEPYVYDAMALRNVANVQAFGIDDGTNAAGAVSPNQLNFVDSDNGLIISDASELTAILGKSGLIDNLEELQILKDGEIVQTIAANELTDSPLGLSLETTIEELDVSLGAENTLTVQASFIDETTSPNSDFIVASGLTPSNVEPLSNIASGSSENDELILGLLDLGADGGEGDDKIVANSYDNLLNGGEGNDTISGHGGNDTITPGNGADQVNGGDGIDTVVYEDQEFASAFLSRAGRIINVNNSDTLTDVEFIQFSDVRISTETLEVLPILEGSNITLIEGNSGTTIAQFTVNLTTPAPVDVLFSYNTVDGSAISGEDYLAASGRVTITAGETSGIVEVEVTADEIFELYEAFGLTLSNISGATFANNEAEYTLVANIENDDIEAPDPTSCNPTSGDDDLTDCATSGDDTINGLEGNDTIVGLAGDDSLDGQADNDSLNGGDGNDSLLGSNGDDTLIGEQGNDSLLGGNHDDSLNGGNGQDTLNGGNGADILLGQNNDDTLNAGNGNDTLNGGAGADKLYGQNDDDTLNGSNGNDTLGGGFGADKLFGQNDDDRLVGNDGNDTLGGGSGADILLGQNDDDTLNGGDGNDTLSGGTGADKLFGQNDDDTLNGGDGNDTLGGGTGADKLFGQNDDDALNGNDGNDTLNGGAGADKLYGQNDEDILNGGDGNDTLSGGTGADKLFGQNDNDTLNGGDGNDTLGGGFGADKLYGQNDDDRLWGGDGNDTLGGGFGADKLFGQNDDDRLVGGLGVDSLTGGAGNDRFVIVSGLTGDRDIIQDYQDGFDLLDLTGGLTFDNLTINQSGDHTNIIETATNETLATLIGIEAVTINDSDFV